MPTYRVTGEVTVSCYTEVEAESEKQAKEEAISRAMAMIIDHGNPEEEWCVEDLDGDPVNINVEEA